MKIDFGISILIPIYNRSIVRLVTQLLDQLDKANIPNYQILCFDDGSQKRYKEKNQVLNSKYRVNYVELSQNHGRAKIRNRLAQMAQYEYLLFLDADSGIVSKKFIQNYLSQIAKHKDAVLSGGRIYNKKPPKPQAKLLHWKYGTLAESKTAKERNKAPTRYFHTNNFLIPTSVMIDYPLDEQIEGYGYEDLAFAEKLHSEGVKILHIDNPIKHLDLCKTDVFLEKQAKAIDNLVKLYQQGYVKDTRLLDMYHKMKRYNLIQIFNYTYEKYLKNAILSNLYGSNPKILYLQLHKMSILINKLGN